MSFNGIVQFEKNLRGLLESESFKKADDGKKLQLGGVLLLSKYGARSLGDVQELKKTDNNAQ